jgi:hypothetical protein
MRASSSGEPLLASIPPCIQRWKIQPNAERSKELVWNRPLEPWEDEEAGRQGGKGVVNKGLLLALDGHSNNSALKALDTPGSNKFPVRVISAVAILASFTRVRSSMKEKEGCDKKSPAIHFQHFMQ